jgi:signal transduction histidine kinase
MDILDFEIIDNAAAISYAIEDRIMGDNSANLSLPYPSLALAINRGFIMAILNLEAASISLLRHHATENLHKIVYQDLPRQRQRIEFALANAAEAAGGTGIAAPATGPAIDTFLLHIDMEWMHFLDGIEEAWAKISADANYLEKESLFWRMLSRKAVSLKRAVLNLKYLSTLRQGDPPPLRSIDVVASIRMAIETIETETVSTNRRILFQPDREAIAVSGWVHEGDNFFAKELIQNAVMFSPPGSEIRISLKTEGSSTSLFVDDDGNGFQEINPAASIQPFLRGSDEAEDQSTYCRIGNGLYALNLFAKRAGWQLRFAEGRSGPRPLLIFR